MIRPDGKVSQLLLFWLDWVIAQPRTLCFTQIPHELAGASLRLIHAALGLEKRAALLLQA